jgi:hypothetical protein
MIAVGILIALVAVAVWLPWRRAVVAALVCALVLASLVWFVEGFGMPFQGMATDPNSGPLLALLVAAYWPARSLAPRGKEVRG